MAQKFNQTTRIFSHATPSMMDIWNEQKAKLKKKFPSLTDSDLRYKEGKKNEMFENLRVKLEISVEDWKKVMKEI
jgi:hypothetical protein